MKLLLITTSFPSANEGSAAAGLFVRDFAEALQRQGADVEVIAPAASKCADANKKLNITYFEVPRLPLSLLNPLRPNNWIAIVKTLVRGQKTVLESCVRERPDHILALWALPSGAWARRATQQYSIPYSVWALGSDVWSLGRIPFIRQHLSGVLKSATHCFADGIKLAADVRHIGGRECTFLPSSRLFGSPNRRLLNSSPPYRFAFLGRWHFNKGPDLLLDALTLLTDSEWSKIEAVRLCGGGPLEQVVRQRAAALTTAGRPVELGGYLDLAAAQALFEWADYIVISSRIESIPVVFSDAMQMRRPVIAMPVGDLPELIKRFDCGITAAKVSAAGLAQALRQALAISPRQFHHGLDAAAKAFQVQTAAADFLYRLQK